MGRTRWDLSSKMACVFMLPLFRPCSGSHIVEVCVGERPTHILIDFQDFDCYFETDLHSRPPTSAVLAGQVDLHLYWSFDLGCHCSLTQVTHPSQVKYPWKETDHSKRSRSKSTQNAEDKLPIPLPKTAFVFVLSPFPDLTYHKELPIRPLKYFQFPFFNSYCHLCSPSFSLLTSTIKVSLTIPVFKYVCKFCKLLLMNSLLKNLL